MQAHPLLDRLRSDLIGHDASFKTPFGDRCMLYCDFAATGRPVGLIEKMISEEVLPFYANTVRLSDIIGSFERYHICFFLPDQHTVASHTGGATTAAREQARECIRQCVHATKSDHAVIFCGSGVTGCVNRMIDVLQLRRNQHTHKHCEEEVECVIFLGGYEHHSNLLPWRESIAKVVEIDLTSEGRIDMDQLERELVRYAKVGMKIGSFSAGSNVTGVVTDTAAVTRVLHRHGALAFFDYAAAGPYLDINMGADDAEFFPAPAPPPSPSAGAGPMGDGCAGASGPARASVCTTCSGGAAPKKELPPPPSGLDAPAWVHEPDFARCPYPDAVFVSTHKFIGGPGTPGVLVAHQRVFMNTVPAQVGGGTVLYVTKAGHVFNRNIEHREEGGTPEIIGSIRAGLAFRLKELIGTQTIQSREEAALRQAWAVWQPHPRLQLLGPQEPHGRLSIVAFIMRLPFGQAPATVPPQPTVCYLHHNFIVVLLNDLFGIQARSGCACAGVYAHHLLQIAQPTAEALQNIVVSGFDAHPGWARLSLHYHMAADEVAFLIRAVAWIATHGWKLLPLYHFAARDGLWRYSGLHTAAVRHDLAL
ncbi:putative Cysteine desulfurase [Paratrimastix pyriformis]|uniref:Cysteine desulfurase n=1 Tax=Paratrimastix pyriformis TaxID=342808 RepID=A0ABQ8UIG4_9EUKA|nr:putative Cysteine desulfurase [Paratrimastix pyriformis]